MTSPITQLTTSPFSMATSTTPVIYDLLGVGIGPFNLGLAALTEKIEALNCIFLDENPTFNWHPGLLLPWARMQVPFHADLVTLADPCSPYSYLAFLKARKRLFKFTILEKYFPLRREYSDYCSWVTRQLTTLMFGFRVEHIEYDEDLKAYRVSSWNAGFKNKTQFYAKRIVVGIGSRPLIPSTIRDKMYLPYLIHAADYLYNKKALMEKEDIAIIGSGQSAAELFFDLLQQYPANLKKLSWITRSSIFPMDYSKFSCEMASPEYTRHFYGLQPEMKEKVLYSQDSLYKGVNKTLLHAIYEKLYNLSLAYTDLNEDIKILPHRELTDLHGLEISRKLSLKLRHTETKAPFMLLTSAAILATGFETRPPYFLKGVQDLIGYDDKNRLDIQANYAIDKKGDSIFIQNAELHTHGFNSADLGLGVYRNMIIINSVLGYEHYGIPEENTFQSF